tara:strand:+ start:26999 stop:27328 length:330 start_codon:yes stop_codon:yes gene_type:complete
MQVNQSDMEAALEFLADTDVDFARAQAYYNALDEQTKSVRASLGFRCKEKSASAKEMFALQTPDYLKHLAKVEVANVDYLTLRAQRATKSTIIDCWRSLNSARGKGNIN